MEKKKVALVTLGDSRREFYKKRESIVASEIEKVKKAFGDKYDLYISPIVFDTEDGQNISDVKRKLRIHREVDAPIKKGSKAGEMIYSAGDRELGRVDILYDKTVPKATYMDALKTVLENL